MSRNGNRALLLDTHVWVWYVEDEAKQFSRRIPALVEAAVQRGDIVISAISVWEIALLEAARRLDLSSGVTCRGPTAHNNAAA